jgi:hypothetical protein
MIPDIEIPEIFAAELFSIETNTDFTLRSVQLDEELEFVTNAFSLNNPIAAKQLVKPSPTSNLYQIELGDATATMIRSIPATGSKLLSAQCYIANLLPDSVFIEPLTTLDGEFFVVKNNTAWIAYPLIPGEIYDGSNCESKTLFESVFNLTQLISDIGVGLHPDLKKAIPCVQHRLNEWPNFYQSLASNSPQNLKYIMGALKDSTRSLIDINQSSLVKLALSSGRLIQNGRTKLVHNDLNHANIIIHQGQPRFLDLEDIVFEIPEISITHALFKLLRHKIYQKHTTLEEAQLIIPTLISRLNEHGFNIIDTASFFKFGSARIISEIHTICMWFVENNDDGLLYDLEKKFHNFFELKLLTGSAHGLTTRR